MPQRRSSAEGAQPVRYPIRERKREREKVRISRKNSNSCMIRERKRKKCKNTKTGLEDHLCTSFNYNGLLNSRP